MAGSYWQLPSLAKINTGTAARSGPRSPLLEQDLITRTHSTARARTLVRPVVQRAGARARTSGGCRVSGILLCLYHRARASPARLLPRDGSSNNLPRLDVAQ